MVLYIKTMPKFIFSLVIVLTFVCCCLNLAPGGSFPDHTKENISPANNTSSIETEVIMITHPVTLTDDVPTPFNSQLIYPKLPTVPLTTSKDIVASFLANNSLIFDYSGDVYKDDLLEFTLIHKKPYFYKIFRYFGTATVSSIDYIDNKYMWSQDIAAGEIDVLPYYDPHCFPFYEDYQERTVSIFTGKYNVTAQAPGIVDHNSVYVVETRYIGNKSPKLISDIRSKIFIDPNTWMVVKFEKFDQNDKLLSVIDIKNISVNNGVQESEFAYTPPPGALVRNAKSPCYGVTDFSDWDEEG
jgi:outer membrane lipoprotein-sorting protein